MRPGHEAWVTRDYGGAGNALTMSKARLGHFVFHLLRCGGDIRSTWAMGPHVDRSYVQFGITLPPGKREEVERITGINLEKPPVVRPVGGRE